MVVTQTLALFVVAAIAEIGGAYLVWQAIREGRGWVIGAIGAVALGLYGVIATFQPDDNFGRIFAAYGGIFIAGSLIWAAIFDGFRPDRWDIAGSTICIIGMTVIMFAPRGA